MSENEETNGASDNTEAGTEVVTGGEATGTTETQTESSSPTDDKSEETKTAADVADHAAQQRRQGRKPDSDSDSKPKGKGKKRDGGHTGGPRQGRREFTPEERARHHRQKLEEAEAELTQQGGNTQRASSAGSGGGQPSALPPQTATSSAADADRGAVSQSQNGNGNRSSIKKVVGWTAGGVAGILLLIFGVLAIKMVFWAFDSSSDKSEEKPDEVAKLVERLDILEAENAELREQQDNPMEIVEETVSVEPEPKVDIEALVAAGIEKALAKPKEETPEVTTAPVVETVSLPSNLPDANPWVKRTPNGTPTHPSFEGVEQVTQSAPHSFEINTEEDLMKVYRGFSEPHTLTDGRVVRFFLVQMPNEPHPTYLRYHGVFPTAENFLPTPDGYTTWVDAGGWVAVGK